jgi:uncharacterized protein (UPF0248 family)
MKHARDVLNEIKWRDEFSFEKTIIFYRDHTQPEPMELPGVQIRNWDKSFIYTISGSSIPFHRVEIIRHNHQEMYRHSRS